MSVSVSSPTPYISIGLTYTPSVFNVLPLAALALAALALSVAKASPG